MIRKNNVLVLCVSLLLQCEVSEGQLLYFNTVKQSLKSIRKFNYLSL
jgi:hypothetical protein